MIIRTEIEIEVKRPAEAVFAYLADAERFPEWATEYAAVEQVGNGTVGAGTRYRFRLKRHVESTFTWTAFEPPALLAWKGALIERRPGRVIPRGSFAVEPAEGGCSRVVGVYEHEIQGLPAFLKPGFHYFMRKGRIANFNRLKVVLEGGAVTEPALTRSMIVLLPVAVDYFSCADGLSGAIF